jgi:bifunctional DNA-binding transcriptional regulator/antitoxin component of YhaV-PrlF toxin-antitoxin module
VRLTIRDRRQVTLSAEICRALGVGVGDTLEVEVDEGVVTMRSTRASGRDALAELRRTVAESGVSEAELLESGRQIRKKVFRERYPQLAEKYGV